MPRELDHRAFDRSTFAYSQAQEALAKLKISVHSVLADAPELGLRNVDIGRQLGIYGGHEGHEGHISRTVLAMMEAEGTVLQDPETNTWTLRNVAS